MWAEPNDLPLWTEYRKSDGVSLAILAYKKDSHFSHLLPFLLSQRQAQCQVVLCRSAHGKNLMCLTSKDLWPASSHVNGLGRGSGGTCHMNELQVHPPSVKLETTTVPGDTSLWPYGRPEPVWTITRSSPLYLLPLSGIWCPDSIVESILSGPVAPWGFSLPPQQEHKHINSWTPDTGKPEGKVCLG